ncbi:DNA-binding response regulator [Actinoplanes sp. NEAU-A12]|uniref:DNA-binding response regulator n=1 Tax=Actinoplanes sandaracinus TaxID=3045177 RepID=A0ABT6WVI6_9ACTN|nr:DNA-binding response regulator [Actinoplanes sandaracinus]MDI6103758.1 DNA-binding response regulator [Actinoplanes sandaracinus]
MPVEVAVVDPLPLFRQGAVTVLTAAGYPVWTPPDVVAWARQASTSAVVLLTVQDEDDWRLLGRLHESEPSHPVVVLLGAATAAAGVRAVRAGARSVMPRQTTAMMLQRTVAATIEGQAVLPAAVAAALASGEDAGDAAISAEKLSWLQALAAGATVAELARHVGYSERAMFRLLRTLYREMGVHSRIEALMRARERGWM